MESLAVAAFPDGEWDSFNKMFSNEEELDLTHQMLHQFAFSSEQDEGLNFINSSSIMCPSALTPEANMMSNIAAGVNEQMLYSSNFDHYNISQESSSDQSSNSSGGSVFVSPPNHETTDHYYLNGSNHVAAANDVPTMSLDISMDVDSGSFPAPLMFPNIGMEDLSSDSLGAGFALAANELLLKRNLDVLELHAADHHQGDHKSMMDANSSDHNNTKKRLRVSKDIACPKVNKKRSRKMSSSIANGNEGESCSTCSSEDDIVSQETSQALNLNGKARASRGSATDPQSLYARKRRERINERLRILQNLVPNGTKVDISTMLEEAVHYVKFLQLQIKLLSSDELWMYAPIAYNGIDIGLTKKISTLL